ncbi:MAG: hypothetical protein HUU09_10590 [Candidatus Jettenia caeni]|nr:hypothetical protein [Candidatus Jettenia caeni]
MGQKRGFSKITMKESKTYLIKLIVTFSLMIGFGIFLIVHYIYEPKDIKEYNKSERDKRLYTNPPREQGAILRILIEIENMKIISTNPIKLCNKSLNEVMSELAEGDPKLPDKQNILNDALKRASEYENNLPEDIKREWLFERALSNLEEEYSLKKVELLIQKYKDLLTTPEDLAIFDAEIQKDTKYVDMHILKTACLNTESLKEKIAVIKVFLTLNNFKK